MPVGSRRDFLKSGLLAAGSAGLGLGLFGKLRNRRGPPAPHPLYGPLYPVPDQSTGLPLLLLPQGFRYHTFGWNGEVMNDGFRSPERCDGMGVVAHEGQRLTLVRNHEIRGSSGPIGDPGTAWDVTGGGTTTLVFDTAAEKLQMAYVSLNGTLNNCAGGVTPWGTWLSCEEAPYTPELAHHGIELRQQLWGLSGANRPHGYVFEVDPSGTSNPEPLWDMGQFYHEASAIDLSTGAVYLTEDRSPHAGFYRFIPNVAGTLSAGGSLQMLRVQGASEMIDPVALFEPLQADWVEIPEPRRGHTPGTHDGRGVVSQGLSQGATAFRGLEGCCWYPGSVYFTSKNSGSAAAGLIFRFDTVNSTLQVVHESPGHGGFSGPDNIILSPRGSLVICEDRESGNKDGQYLAGLDSEGELFAFGQINPAISANHAGHDLAHTMAKSEWAGICYSPDGTWMFANVYAPGFTCAITGPWVVGLI